MSAMLMESAALADATSRWIQTITGYLGIHAGAGNLDGQSLGQSVRSTLLAAQLQVQ